jgi:hypothetical protein
MNLSGLSPIISNFAGFLFLKQETRSKKQESKNK